MLPAHASSRHTKPYSAGVLTRAVRENEEHFGIPHFTPHDLRRTCRTGLSYDMYDYLEEKRDALERWAKHLQAIIEGRDAKCTVGASGMSGKRGTAPPLSRDGAIIRSGIECTSKP